MSKAILVMDIPANCSECDICSSEGYCMKTYKFCHDRYTTKQKWCPLKPMPKKLILDHEQDQLAIGWNACIDKIIGEELS